jgi:hypothetical protein
MPVPNTGGTLRTSISDMQVGDYIICGMNANTSGQAAQIGYAGSTGYSGEVALAGQSTTPSGQWYSFYFIKADKGLLIADRVIQHTISWDTLNSAKYIQGGILTLLGGVNGIIRSLGGGCAYADIPSLRDLVPKQTANTVSIIGTSSMGNHYYLFDDTTSTEYISELNKPIGYDFGSPTLVKEVSFTLDNKNRAPKDWRVEGWNGTSWVVLHSVTGDTSFAGITAMTKRNFPFNNSVSYSKYQVIITDVNADTYFAIRELELLNPSTNPVVNASTTDYGQGAAPIDNEWDKYIVGMFGGRDDVWHWSSVSTWTQDTVEIRRLPANYRMIRGRGSSLFVGDASSSTNSTVVGFRPAFQYEEVTP